MRIITITLLIFLSCASFYAQDKKESSDNDSVIDFSSLPNDDPGCGEANSFGFRKGKITKIINGKTVVFSVNDEYETKTYKVILAGIDLSKNSKMTKKLLIENLLNKDVVVIGNEIKDGSKELLGIIHTFASSASVLGEVNRYILENGLAKYIEPKKHLVPNYRLCEYRKIAKLAKEKKIGIWAN